MNQNNQGNLNYQRRKDDSTLEVVVERINVLHEDVSDIRVSLKESMKEMTQAFNKLIQLEEKQIYIIQDLQRVSKISERAHERLDKTLIDEQAKYEKLENRLDALEKDSPLQKQTSAWVLSAVYAAAGMLVMYAAKVLGIV